MNERTDLDGDPPDGLIAHTLATSADGAVIANVWESTEHFEAFRTA